MFKNLVSVVIPIYKEIPNELEIISLKQCCKVLGHYPNRLIAPFKLNTEYYEKICCNIKDLVVERFDDAFFENIVGYNKLMLSSTFYKRFIKFKYILIYQLDAFVFRDDLKYWCNLGYDYIGAPWFEEWHNSTSLSKIIGVGNGGFSLRNAQSILNHIKILKKLQVIYKYEKYNWKGLLTRFYKIIYDVIFYKSYELQYKLTNGQEDYFWCLDMESLYNEYSNNKSFVAKLFKIKNTEKLKIADENNAIKFSFECQPSHLYKKNSKKLPFGCHAWQKYEYEFWKPFIEAEGYELP